MNGPSCARLCVEGDGRSEIRAARKLPVARMARCSERQRVLDDAEEDRAPATAPPTDPVPPAIEIAADDAAGRLPSSNHPRYRRKPPAKAREPRGIRLALLKPPESTKAEKLRPAHIDARVDPPHGDCRRPRRSTGLGRCAQIKIATRSTVTMAAQDKTGRPRNSIRGRRWERGAHPWLLTHCRPGLGRSRREDGLGAKRDDRGRKCAQLRTPRKCH